MPIARKIQSRKTEKRQSVAKCNGTALNMIRAMIRRMDLSELLELSEYVDKVTHGESSSLPDSAKARNVIVLMAKMHSASDFAKAISELNTQIIIKNRNSVNEENAKKTYLEFMKAE